ncbi:MAG: glycosyltransferase family 4 protein [bacterium]|jgi:glycosyltransferase involved in cell wall biosynthesis
MHRILFINWRDIRNPEAGGAEVHLHEISRRIAALGHSVTVLASRFPGAADREVIDGVEVVRAGGKFSFNFHVPGAFRKLAREKPFDIVVDDINKVPFYTPVFVRTPVLALAHHLFGRTIFLEASAPIALYVYLTESLIPFIYRNTRFVVVSNSTRDEMLRRGLKPGNVSIVYNAVDHSKYRPLPEARSKEPLIGYVGRIKRYKRVDVLLKALKIVRREVPGVRLRVAGSGDHLNALQDLTGRLGLSDLVDFMGFVTEEQKIEMLRQVHVVANPSSKEGWGVTVIEANACGTPVVASNVPGLRDAVVHGETGLLVPYGDVEALARGLTDLLLDDAMRESLAGNALEWAGRFSWDASARGILDEIDRITGA